MSVSEAVFRLFKRRSEFLIVGLTGRTGSGCSTAGRILQKSFGELRLEASPSPLAGPEQRKYAIVRRFAEKNWVPFSIVSVTQVIASFIFDAEETPVENFLNHYVKEKDREAFYTEIRRIRPIWRSVSDILAPPSRPHELETVSKFLRVWESEIANFLGVAKRVLGTSYAPAFQAMGDNLRRNGTPIQTFVDPQKFAVLPVRVGEVVVALRRLAVLEERAAYVVVDALRNPFEIQYFRERFANFFLMAVTTEDSDRISRLSLHSNFASSEIKKLDSKEYPAQNKPLGGYDQFVSQNIQACIEKADIFVNNPGEAREGYVADVSVLSKQLVSFVTLMLHPGLVTPTKVERCMQIAYSAKANSGCISRQVGATVTDEAYSIKAVGWNDVPEGQVPCLLRQAEDLIGNTDHDAFSDYELKNEKFRRHVEGRYKRLEIIHETGRSSPLCFKAEYHLVDSPKGGRVNQVHTRSLHAEENAFLQVSKNGGQGLAGGILFSTASPCELCSKKAFQLGIKQIYYIDPYPGIAMSQILNAGPVNRRPQATLFSGAVGQAFHRLYDPLLPFKDEFWALVGESTDDDVKAGSIA